MRYATVSALLSSYHKSTYLSSYLKYDTKQAALIELMLSEDPRKRPSAEEISSRVKTLKEDVEEDVTIPPLKL